jgi:ABC-type multidrug transport system fused ATPase/permease subunit
VVLNPGFKKLAGVSGQNLQPGQI